MNLYLFIETTVPFCIGIVQKRKWLKTILLDTGLDSPSTTDKQPTIRCIQHYNKSTRISKKRQHFCQRRRLPNPVNTDQLHHLDPVNLSSMPIGEITSACSGKDLPFAHAQRHQLAERVWRFGNLWSPNTNGSFFYRYLSRWRPSNSQLFTLCSKRKEMETSWKTWYPENIKQPTYNLSRKERAVVKELENLFNWWQRALQIFAIRSYL